MQKKSDAPSEEQAERQAFSPFVKDQALKILDDYSLMTGRKWQAILSEIIKVTGLRVTEKAPIITRQDLESWVARNSILGDHKFKWVMKFLTHPDTLARPEFAKANDLVSFGTIERVGEALADFFSDYKMSGYIKRVPAGEVIHEETIEYRMNDFQGEFVGEDDGNSYCLSIERFGQSRYFVAHFFSWPSTQMGETSDWEIERYSGFCTVGNMMRLHTKGVVTRIVRDLFLIPILDEDIDQVTGFSLIKHSLLTKSIENIQFDSFTAAHRKLKFIDPTNHRIRLKRQRDSQLTEFIDQFRWNIVI